MQNVYLVKKKGSISHDIWIADETELKANANKRKRMVVVLERFDRLYNVHDTYAKEATLDAGYYNVRIGEGLEKREMFAYISYRRHARNEHPKCKTTQFRKVEEDLYACPYGVPFFYKNSTRQGYHEYRPPKESCKGCPYAKTGDRVLRISVHQDVYERLHSQRLSPRGKVLRSVRPSTVERSFAESKELHGFRYARYRGVQKITIQVLMTAISQNLKKWARLRSLRESGIDLTYQKK